MGQNKVVRKLNRELRKKYQEEGIEPTHKYCSRCNQLKEVSEFFKRNNGHSLFGVMPICIDCKYEKDAIYLSVPENKQHRKEYLANYFQVNKKEIQANQEIYNEKNKEHLSAKSAERRRKNRGKKNENHKFRYKTEEDYRTKKLLRGRLLNVMMGKKNKKADEYGIDWNLCLEHLGSRPDKINSWHIDHIIPCSVFNFLNESHPAICFHPSNLRWATEEENLSKGEMIYKDLIEKHNLQWVIDFLELDIDKWNEEIRNKKVKKNKTKRENKQ